MSTTPLSTKGYKMLIIIVLIIVAIVAVACGGGKGGDPSSNSPETPVPPVATRTDKVLYGYFGQFDNQNAETADHVTYIFSMDWGDWSTPGIEPSLSLKIIGELQDAKARGITKAIVAVGYLTWTGKYDLKGTQYLEVFKTQLQALGLYDMIEAFYPMDEPDLQEKQGGLSDTNLIQGLANIHQVFPDKKLMVIYGDHGGLPAQKYYDIVGKDDYGKGLITIPLLPGQRLALLRGGADPWKEDPTPAVDYALSHPEVVMIVNFIYGDYTGGKGIRNNGMLPIYKQQGQRLQ